MKKERIIFFDGYCNLCNNSVDFILKRDHKKQFKFASLQGECAKKLLSQDLLDNPESLVLYHNQKVLLKSTAALKIAKEIGFPWVLFSYFDFLPLFLRDGVYNFIAKNRFRFFGKRDSCRLPDESERSYFLP